MRGASTDEPSGGGSALRTLLWVAAGLSAGALAGVIALRRRYPVPFVLHVVPNGDGWRLTREDGEALQAFDRKREAVEAARELAHRRIPSRLVIHRADGTIQKQHQYDPETTSG